LIEEAIKRMKKLVVAAIVMAVIGLVGTMAYAAWQGGPGGQVDVNAFRQFQKETLPLRDEMMAKGLEVRNELNKQNPDQNRITQLRTEMSDLRTRIQAAAEKQGLPGVGNGPGAGRGWGSRMMGRGCGNGPCFGAGPGQGGRCPAWQ
jgi:hypothetical protein